MVKVGALGLGLLGLGLDSLNSLVPELQLQSVTLLKKKHSKLHKLLNFFERGQH